MTPEQRKQFLDIVNRRAQPGSGSDPLVLREQPQRYGAPDLQFLVGRVEFAIVGGLATRLYMPERMTLDADILVRAEDEHKVESVLQKAGCHKHGSLNIGGSIWKMPSGWSLDVVALNEPWTDEALRLVVAGHDNLPYISLSYLVLMKLISSRTQDLADISRMLGCADDDSIEGTRRIVTQYRPQDMEDLDSLIRLGKLESGSRQGE